MQVWTVLALTKKRYFNVLYGGRSGSLSLDVITDGGNSSRNNGAAALEERGDSLWMRHIRREGLALAPALCPVEGSYEVPGRENSDGNRGKGA